MIPKLTQRTVRAHVSIGLVVFLLGLGAIPVQAEESSEPKSIRKTCGKCPDGYATTGVTESKEICKDGSSSVPARCGNQDGGRMTQCQLDKMELNLPDPTQGGKICPPDCGSTATPGQGALPPPPKYLPTPEKK